MAAMLTSKKMLGLLLLVSLLAHLALASIERPAAYSRGSSLNIPSGVQWQHGRVDSFRVATFNIRRSKGTDGVRDLKRIGDVLRGADIIGLQELSGTLFYGWTNQAEQLARQLKLGWLFAPTLDKWYQPYSGNGLLSKFEVKNWTTEPLPRDVDSERMYRNLITATVAIGRRDVTLLVSHIERDELNARQLKFVLGRFTETSGPVILFADLNADLNNELIKTVLMDAANKDAILEAIGDFWRLDWILTRGFDVIRGGYTPRGLSDHAHYWLDLKFSETAAESRELRESRGRSDMPGMRG